MSTKPILFNTEMVKAILEGRKTVTRRIIKPTSKDADHVGILINDITKTIVGAINCNKDGSAISGIKPPYQIGDILYVMAELKGYDCKYACDLIGNIFSKASGNWKQLKPHDQGNYKRLTLRKNGKDVNKCVHNLVCEAWYGNKPFEKAIVRHLDGNSHNNKANNLDWGTYKQNWDDRKYDNRGIHEEHHNAKITMDDAIAMRASGKTYQELCKEYGLTSKTVQRILNNETWIEHYEKTPPNYERWLPDENIWLKVTDLRIERVEDITEEQAYKEGFYKGWKNPKLPNSTPSFSARQAFMWVWHKLYGIMNDYVWVIEFERIEKGDI